MEITAKGISSSVEEIRRKAPLVHNITNYVVMNTTANALLALGASPVMAHAIEEVEDMVTLSGALVVNIGTLSRSWVESMLRAAHRAKERGIPVIFDPVGAGATAYRTAVAQEITHAVSPEIIRGNASEIIALAGDHGATRGVDSTETAGMALDAARRLSTSCGSVVSISGETDYIIDGPRIVQVQNGHALMTRVTGLGCCATALSGAFACVNGSMGTAASQAMAIMGIAGEMAFEGCAGPGTLQLHFLDTLHTMGLPDIERRLKVSVSS